MEKTIFRFDPKPTFDLVIPIPVPGEGYAPVTFTCRYRTRKQYSAFVGGLTSATDTDVVSSIVTGWNLDVDFTPENIEKLVENYMGAAAAILAAYSEELMRVREKN
ncbi:phage tail assembly chaperone [Oxalobacter aliiformigenes]|uniref:phage tail assembly chaperone n=1 Tax=Oxalobacter aliiformigenes TaxID=2946593 RepID=UPI0022AF2342|nr:phage tail assembly chaperone [Oxalobacter aliiformigenes]MCZ4065725.1 phage tail assembly chaperone [Oxalobacter aliiformigenes]WAV98643.1 phage tail assembly chaperone [Oxalobacter aliiformigenes]